jgi:outer membrane protein OmpA-like peptidoglycan-associated protein
MSTLRRARGDMQGESAEKAFWISFADLMTALMVLFLALMVVAMMAITRAQVATRSDAESKALPPSPRAASRPAEHLPSGPDPRAEEQLLTQMARVVDATPGIHFDAQLRVIDFGDRARFQTGSHELDAASAKLLREFVPRLLEVTESQAGRQWVSRVVVEGFADHRGDYLYNLNLSLQRGQRVLCALLEPAQDGSGLSPQQAAAVKEIFAVGGFSFNEQRESLDASRRIELRVEFGPRAARAPSIQARDAVTGGCRLQGGARWRPADGANLAATETEGASPLTRLSAIADVARRLPTEGLTGSSTAQPDRSPTRP